MFPNITHMLCGADFDEKELGEAMDIYEIPCVTSEWVRSTVRLGRLACTKAYQPSAGGLFAPIVAAITDLNANDRKKLYALITFHGGRVERNFCTKTTHLVCGTATGNVYKFAVDKKSDKFAIVTPDWFFECLKAQELIDTVPYHPRLLTSVGINSAADTRSLASIIGLDDPKVEVKKIEPAKPVSAIETIPKQTVTSQITAKSTTSTTINTPNTVSTTTTTLAQQKVTETVKQKTVEPSHTKPLMDASQIVQRNIPNQTMTNQTKPTEQLVKEKMVCILDFIGCLLELKGLMRFFVCLFSGTATTTANGSSI